MNWRASCGLHVWYPWFRTSEGYTGLRCTALHHSICWTRVKFPVSNRWSVLYQSDEERNNAECLCDKYLLATYFTKIKECFACSCSRRLGWTSGLALGEGTNHRLSSTHFDLQHHTKSVFPHWPQTRVHLCSFRHPSLLRPRASFSCLNPSHNLRRW
jgi:hypothetical protein